MGASPRLSCLMSFDFKPMDQNMILISRDTIAQILTMLHRSKGYFEKARPSVYPQREEDLYAEPTEFYSGASGFALGTMKYTIEKLESHLQ